jgi:toxin-antitoxin system PIN domain toxin
MIIPDINLLLYAHIDSFEQHGSARHWWEALLGGDAEVGVPAPAVFGFVRIATNPRVFDPPMSVEVALRHVELWMQQPIVRCPVPGPRHMQIAFRLLRQLGTAANLTTDAQLAAFAIESQGELHSSDTDFGRFPGLRWRNPLE